MDAELAYAGAEPEERKSENGAEQGHGLTDCSGEADSESTRAALGVKQTEVNRLANRAQAGRHSAYSCAHLQEMGND